MGPRQVSQHPGATLLWRPPMLDLPLNVLLAVAADASTPLSEVATDMLFQVVGGLGIFLLGMKYMSEGMQAIAGRRLRRMISVVTDNRLAGVGTGTLVTCIVQSSSITTVLVVGFATSGLMALHQAIGVIMGANIGTTITGWILVLKIGKYGLPILGTGAFVYLFSKVERRRFTALAIMGLGMVFFGLVLMKDGFKPVRSIPAFSEAFVWFDASTFKGVALCVVVGSVLTGIVQSSSATLGITIAIAAQGVISFETAAALVLGQNIGTTITAWLASIGTNTVAKRAAYFHILFNTAGVLVMLILFRGYIAAIANVVEFAKGVDPRVLDVDSSPDFVINMTFAIATAHTVFNVLVTLVNLPFVKQWAQLLERIVPAKGREVRHLAPIGAPIVGSPAVAIERSRRQIMKMGSNDLEMLEWLGEIVSSDVLDEELVEHTFRREKIMDNVQSEVIDFLTKLMSGNVPFSVAREGRIQLRIADELESISDYITGILKSNLRLRQASLSLRREEKQTLATLHKRTLDTLRAVLVGFERSDPTAARMAHSEREEIADAVKAARNTHLMRMTEERVDPVHSIAYTRLLQGYRKIADHTLNVAETVLGESDADEE